MQGDLRLRLTGIGLLLPLIFAILMGGPVAVFALILISVFLTYELARLLSEKTNGQIYISAFILFPALLLATFQSLVLSVLILLGGSFVLIYRKGVLAGIYASCLALCFCSFIYFLRISEFHILLLAIGFVIASVDSGAYMVGRQIGGWKLAPKISPKKTISGAIGGFVFGLIAGLISLPFLGFEFSEMIVISIVISIVAQIGDLFESALKRKLNVKDSGRLIPGHGGLLDRFDGYILVIPLLTMLNMFVGVIS